MKIIVSALLLCTSGSVLALGEAIETYRQNHPNQSTTVITTNPQDTTTTTDTNVIYAPTVTTGTAVVAPAGNNLNRRAVEGRNLQNRNDFQQHRDLNHRDFNREGIGGRHR